MVMIVGEGMHNTIGLAARATAALAQANVNIEMLNQGSSEVSLGLAVQQKKKVIESQGRKQVKLADYLGFDHQLVPIISKRVEEVLEESDE